MSRLTWDEYFIYLAYSAAKMSTCLREKVGAILVKDKRIISTGYNGAPRGLEHCTDVGCLIVNNHCTRAVHAEANALIFGKGSTLYCTHQPCYHCAGLIINAGIGRVVYDTKYGKPDSIYLMLRAGIVVEV